MTASSKPVHIVQNCYVVKNLDAACAYFNRLYGIGPFVGGVPAELSAHFYRGEAAPSIHLRGVFVQSGDLNIELVELISTTPSAFHDMYPGASEGFHHTAMFCDDYEGQKQIFTEAGYEVASEFTVSFGAKICYVDARRTHGHMIELYPENEIIRGMYKQARDAAIDWDGKQLIIPWMTGIR